MSPIFERRIARERSDRSERYVASVVRVVLVGDSHLSDTSSGAVTKLGPRLRQRGHEVETVAVDGLDTRAAVAADRRSQPADWTVFCFGTNDAAPWKRVPPEEFATNYTTLLARANSPNVLVLGLTPVTDSGLPGARTNRLVAEYSAIAAQTADRVDAAFIPLHTILGPDDLAEDGVHLNDRGYDALEHLVVETIEPPLDTSDTSST